jgi:hypothetical protein
MTAFLFVPLLALTWIFGLAVIAHAAHYFLTIVESSATPVARNVSWRGRPFREWIRDGVAWPDDGFVDFFGKAFYLAYLIGVWAGPAILVGRLAVGGDSPWVTVIAGAAFWLFFPIGLLSSLSSESRWTPFRPGLVGVLARRPGKTLAFYLLSAPALAVVFLTFDLILLRTEKVGMAWAIGLSPLAVLAFFVYARLLGRLGLIVTFVPTRAATEKPARARGKKKRRLPVPAYDPTTRWVGPTEVIPDEPPARAQPTDLPGLETPMDGIVTGYAVDYDGKAPPPEAPAPARTVHKFDDEDDTPIGVAPAPDVSGTDRQKLAAELCEPSEREMDLILRERPTEPANPYGSESVTFLFDPKTIEPWLRLTAGLVGLALLQRALDALRPI